MRARVDGHLIEVHASADHHGNDGATVISLLRDGDRIAELSLYDELRDDAASTVATLTGLTRVPPMLITGDNTGAATALAQHAGIAEVRAELLPHQKAETVRALHDHGLRLLVVGDGSTTRRPWPPHTPRSRWAGPAPTWRSRPPTP